MKTYNHKEHEQKIKEIAAEVIKAQMLANIDDFFTRASGASPLLHRP